MISLLFLPLLNVVFPLGGLQWSTITIYLVVSFFFSMIYAEKKWKLVPFIFIAYCILHFSYGIGFLYGLWKFRSKWKSSETTNNFFDTHKFILNSTKQK